MTWNEYLTELENGLNSLGLTKASELFDFNIVPETLQNNQYCIIPGNVKISENQQLGRRLGMTREFEINVFHEYFNVDDLSELNEFVEKIIKYIEIDFNPGFEGNSVNGTKYNTNLQSREVVVSISIGTNYTLEA